MKLHLPNKLRKSLIACICSAAAVGTTLSTGAFVSGVAAFTLTGQAMAEDTDAIHNVKGDETISDLTYADYETINVSGGTLNVTYACAWGDNVAGAGFTKGDVNVTNGATLLLSGADALGYAYKDAENYVKTITLEGVAATDGGEATLTSLLVDDEKITLETDLVLKGNTQVAARDKDGDGSANGYLQANGAGITVSGDNNTISAKVDITKSLTIAGTGTLAMGDVINSAGLVIDTDTTIATYSGSGSIKVADNTKMVITGESGFKDASLKLLDLLSAATSEEGYSGTVVLSERAVCGGTLSAITTTEVKGNYQFYKGLSVNSNVNWRTDNYTIHTVLVREGGSLIAQDASGNRQDMEFLSNQQLTIDGGTVVAKGLKIGHSSTGTYSGTLMLQSGSLSVDYINLQNVNNSEGKGSLFKMTGGTLEILSDTWATGETNGAFRISDNDTELQLLGGVISSANGGWWAGLKSGATKMTLGGGENALVFSGGSNITIARGNAYFAGTVTNNVGSGATLRLSSDSYTVEDYTKLEHTELSEPASDTDGFGTAQYYLVKAGDNAGTFHAGSLTTVSVNGTPTEFTINNGSAYFTAASTLYYVNTDSASYSNATSASGIVLNGGTMSVASGTNVTQGITVSAESAIVGAATPKGNSHAGLSGDIKGTANLTIYSEAGTVSDTHNHGNYFALGGNIDLSDESGNRYDLIISQVTNADGTTSGGVVRLGDVNEDTNNKTHTIKAGNIVVKSGATLEIVNAGGTLDTGLTLSGGELHLQGTGTSGSTVSFTSLTVDGSKASAITSTNFSSNVSFGSLTGTGDLNINTGKVTTIESVSNYSGTLSSSENNAKLYILGINQSKDKHATITGKTYSSTAGFTMSGAGSAALGTHVAEGAFTVESGTLSVDSLTASDTVTVSGGTLNIGTGGIVKASGGGTSITLAGGTLGATGASWTTNVATKVTGNAEIDTSYTTTVDGEATTAGAAITMGDISVDADKVLSVSGAGSLTVDGAMTNAGSLEIGANTTVTTYSMGANNTGTLDVAADKTFTITDSSAYKHAGGSTTAFWNLLASAKDSAGTVVIQAADNIGNDTNLGSGKTVSVLGHYKVEGTVHNNNGGEAITVNIADGNSLEVTGNAEFVSMHTVAVSDGGKLTVGKTLTLGHDSAGTYYGRLTISGAESAVTAKGITLNNNGASDNYIEMTGGTLTVGADGIKMLKEERSGKLVLTGGTVKASDAAGWEAGENVAVTLGAVTFDNGTATITLNGATTFTNTVTNKGSLTLNGALTVADYTQLTAKGSTTTSEKNGNGFVSGDFWLVQGSGDSASLELGKDISTATVNGNPLPLTLQGGGAYFTVVDNSTYHLKTGKGDSAHVYSVGSASYTAESLELNGGDLSMAANLSEATTGGISVKQNGSISLAKDVVLADSQVTVADSATLTLKGEGTYSASSQSSLEKLNGLADTANWNGTLQISAEDMEELDLNNYGSTASSVEFKGAKGYLNQANGSNGSMAQTYKTNIILTNTNDGTVAVDFSNGYGGDSRTFSGTVSGTGDMVRSSSGSGQSFFFSGDVKDWTGSFTQGKDANGTTSVTFTGDAVTVNAALKGESSSRALTVTVDNEKNVTFNSAVTGHTSLTFKGAGTTTVTNTDSDYDGPTTVESGAVMVNEGVTLGSSDVRVTGGELTLVNSTLKGAVKAGEAATIAANATYEGVTVTKGSLSNGTISSAEVTISAGFALSGVTVDDCSFTVKEALSVTNSSSFTGTTTVNIGYAGKLISDGTLSLTGEGHELTLTLTEANVGLSTIDGVSYATLSSSQLWGLGTGTDASFVLNLVLGEGVESWASLLGDAQGIKLVFTDPTNSSGISLADTTGGGNSSTSSAGKLTFTLSEATLNALAAQNYTFTDSMTSTINSDGSLGSVDIVVPETGGGEGGGEAAIPEPTTATLSLLALAALAARRRRK